MEIKKCKKCKKEKLLKSFQTFISSSGKTLRRHKCIHCHNTDSSFYQKQYYLNPERRFSMYQVSAEKRGHSFELSMEEFRSLLLENCVYCGQEGGGIDRYDNDFGYFKENCVPCCGRCNRMKMSFPATEFIEHCKKVANFNN